MSLSSMIDTADLNMRSAPAPKNAPAVKAAAAAAPKPAAPSTLPVWELQQGQQRQRRLSGSAGADKSMPMWGGVASLGDHDNVAANNLSPVHAPKKVDKAEPKKEMAPKTLPVWETAAKAKEAKRPSGEKYAMPVWSGVAGLVDTEGHAADNAPKPPSPPVGGNKTKEAYPVAKAAPSGDQGAHHLLDLPTGKSRRSKENMENPQEMQPRAWSGISSEVDGDYNCMPSPPPPGRRSGSKQDKELKELLDVSDAAEKEKEVKESAEEIEADRRAEVKRRFSASGPGHFDLSPLNQIISG